MAAPTQPWPAARAVRRVPWLVALSGAAALTYESLWLRSFGLIFGGTTSAVAMVLAVFMGGLAIGSALAARRAVAHPLQAYGRLELLTGALALLTLPLLRALPWAYGALVARGGLTAAAEHLGLALLAALVLLPPTILLGATVPLAVEFLARSGSDVHAGFGRLYLLNTLGGALGVALAPFVLVPALGVRGTLVSAALLSLLVGGAALRLARELGPTPASAAGALPGGEGSSRASQAADKRGASRVPALAPALAFASGAATFGVEVLWTRSYALVIGSTVYAFSLMLLAVLLGIALGSAAYAARLARGGLSPRPEGGTANANPARVIGALFVLAGVAVLAGQWAIGRLPIVSLALLDLLPVSFGLHQLAFLLLCFATLLPVTLVLGLTFPLLLHLSPRSDGAQRAAGRLYAWNTGGAIAGALAADLVLVPRLGLQPPYLLFAALLVAGGAWALGATASRLRLAGPLAAAAVAIAALALAPRWKPWDPVLMTSGVHRYGLQWIHRLDSPWRLGSWLREQRKLLFYAEGREAVVAVSEPLGGGNRFLSVNGKTDAGSGTEDVVTQKFIAHVPMLLHRGPKRVLVIGWGAGATAAAAAAHPLERLECVEVEPATWQAAPFFPDFHGPLQKDPRFGIVFRDGRNHLLRSGLAFDLVVSEPSNPWITGVSNLFTREFLEAARARLARGGLFAQWFHYYNLDPADLKVELQTFLAVFPHASLWLVPPVGPEDGIKSLGADMLLIGSGEPQRLDWPRLERAFADPALGRELRSTQVLKDALALAATWTMGRAELARFAEDRQAFPRGTPLNTDDQPYLEFTAPRRTVVRPSEAARQATAQYAAMGAVAGEVRGVLDGVPALAAGGTLAAGFLRDLAERHVAAVQPERALRAFDAATKADPDDAAAHARAAELLAERGRLREALARHGEVVRIDPARAAAWEAIGGLALDLRDYQRAEEAHRALLRLEPAKVSAWLRLTAVLARQQRWREAREAIAKAQALDPKAAVDPQLLAFLEAQAGTEAATPAPAAR
jgi:spermidine synthase